MDDLALGARNLAAFIAATSGRNGTVAEVRGGTVIAAPVPVAHGYVDAAVPTDAPPMPIDFLDDALAFYAEQARPFVLWVPASDDALTAEAVGRGGVADIGGSPAMSRHAPIERQTDLNDLTVTRVTDDEQGAVFGDLAEQGYATPGLGWLMTHHDCFRAPGCTWAIVSDHTGPLGVAAGFVHTTVDGTTGGIYYVATPEAHRGRGAAASATVWLTNRLFEAGAGRVVLQASAAGFPIYLRLGFEVYDTYRRFTFAVPAVD